MGNLAIIPARGGSKRIPKKNIKNFLGKPIIAYSIEVARKSGLFERVIVSTDDHEIAEVAMTYGAEVPFLRSQKNSDDYAPLSDVIDEVVDQLPDSFDYVCCILPTAPLLQAKHLIESFKLLKFEGFDSIRPVVQFSYPIQKAFKLDINGSLSKYFSYDFSSRSQDFEAAFHDAGLFYWMSSEARLHGQKKGGYTISTMESQDIDNLDDWELAILKYKALYH